ncbi:Enolase, C-terminal TIM barrel domain containing protein [Tritrichomonas foetus]|uniref:phosphopyruvate hydratase n=1 Tax=Tritrichomonas foetus TaxID=1144522 RepID=A0A1J4KIY3_9EUKA|nr:Enolase, C-terminal TIM barrel domain containing protein [Tritrichomonas foetus]|eukprot:OHT10896.1 Enolase, C-terminal TIM barrel domain containing protein [Tritrichomonas foetus]
MSSQNQPKGQEKAKSKGLRAIDYIRDHCIEQRLVEYIGQVVHERPPDPYGVMANQFASQSKLPTISHIKGHEILISTGRPSLLVYVYANMLGRNRLAGTASAPLGTSVFSQEIKPYLDTNSTRFIGLGSRNACSLVEIVSVALQGKTFTTIDQFDLIIKKALEGKSGIVNVFSAISFALAIASAEILHQPLFMYLYESFFPQQAADHFTIPTPAVTVLEGGMHSQSPMSFEAIMIIPKATLSFIEQLRVCSEVAEKLKTKLYGDSQVFPVGKSGGLVFDSSVIATAISTVERAIVEAGFSVDTDFTIGIDAAASCFYDNETQKYQVEKGVSKNAAELVQYYIDLITQHKSITLINDGISEVDHGGWELMRDALMSRLKVFGGDIYASQSILARRGLKKKWTDGIMLQLGQAGTITDASETAKLFKQRGKQVGIARRSGETCDTIIADFAVAIQSEYYMAGGLIGAEGISKYNQMLRIYEYLRDRSLLQ